MKQHHPGIYIHIPFCHTKCGYCDFYSITDLTFCDSFINALITEIRLMHEQLNPSGTFDTIYFGGGTPSILKVDHIEQILESLRSNFNLEESISITLEANPGTLDDNKLNNIQNLGINRLSIGIQSFITEELDLLNRIHTAKEGIDEI